MCKANTLLLAAVLAIAGALAGTALHAQQGINLQNLAPNTVVGRLGSGLPGPAQAIPFTSLPTNVPAIDLNKLGAVGDGVTDNTTIIQNAINAHSGGARLIFETPGTYCISSTIGIGNGSTSAQSTVSGIYFEAPGGLQGDTIIQWCGGSGGSPMFTVNGPLKGWGITNLVLNCASLTTVGLDVVAGYNGNTQNLSVLNCQNAIILESRTSAATGNPNSQFNTFTNTLIQLPTLSNSKAITLRGPGSNTSNSSFNKFDTTSIVIPNPSNLSYFGVWLGNCDNNLFINLAMFGGGNQTRGIEFDYTETGGTPVNNTFVMYDPDGNFISSGATTYANNGSPPSGFFPVNRFYGVGDTNGQGSNTYPKLQGTSYVPEIVNPSVDLSAQTSSVSATNILGTTTTPTTGIYQIVSYLEVTTTGAGGATLAMTLAWTDDGGSQSQTVTTGMATSSRNQFSSVLPVRITSGTSPTIAVTVTGTIGAAQYAVHAKLIRLD